MFLFEFRQQMMGVLQGPRRIMRIVDTDGDEKFQLLPAAELASQSQRIGAEAVEVPADITEFRIHRRIFDEPVCCFQTAGEIAESA